MRIKIISLVIILAFGLILGGCNSIGNDTSIPDGMVIAENDLADYTFCYPEDWELDMNSTMMSVIGGGTALHPANKSISVMVLDLANPNVGAIDFWNEYKASFDGTFKEFTAEEPTEVTVDDNIGCTVVYTAKITDATYKYAQTIVIKQGTVYLITFTATPDDYNETIDVYNNVLNTFKFK
ncbi:MAG: hypothetical protein A2Y17_08535 [Clostridiales bacterium GWF2_38_85]|nr:MAG: hypothetical protein A2Y17_08535 [Clostridiales bacterium GWF2_38_85]HBL83759.1 hypothetical protein [Clostridiales bacterium]